jgi:hypothetical protein
MLVDHHPCSWRRTGSIGGDTTSQASLADAVRREFVGRVKEQHDRRSQAAQVVGARQERRLDEAAVGDFSRLSNTTMSARPSAAAAQHRELVCATDHVCRLRSILRRISRRYSLSLLTNAVTLPRLREERNAAAGSAVVSIEPDSSLTCSSVAALGEVHAEQR